MKRYRFYLLCSVLSITLLSLLLRASPQPPHSASLLAADLAPALLVKLLPGDTASVALGVSDVDIDIKVTGNIAVTTMSLNFYNDQDRNLEGQFIFPLADGQTIHSFAMDVNGTMREGAVVEKEKGREVFEKVERRRVDPGLLEWSQGNNFSARVFPIPSKGYKKIVVSFQQELQPGDKALTYHLPLGFKARVKHFSIKATVGGDALQPVPMDDNAYMLNFTRPLSDWQAEVNYHDIIPDHAVQFQVPWDNKAPSVYVQKVPGTTDSYYFYALVKADVKNKPKEEPKKLGIIWDVSGSAASRDRDRETDIIKAYLGKLKNVQVQVTAFSSSVNGRMDFDIKGGDTRSLIEYLLSFEPDGGTQLGCLDLSASTCDEMLLFSDGVQTFGDRNIKLPKCPVYTFSTGQGADYSMLQYISRSTGGRFIDASVLKAEEVLPQLSSTGFNFISASAQGAVSEIYPSVPVPCSGYFGIAGIIQGKGGSLHLDFGPGSHVSQQVDVNLGGAKAADETIGRIWAQKKIADLSLQPEQNKEQITALGKQFSIITHYTSLIVLESLSDYLRYGITPKDEKLKADYDKNVKASAESKSIASKDHADKVAEDFKKVVTWWNTDYKPVYPIDQRDSFVTDSSGRRHTIRRGYHDTGGMADSTVTFSAVNSVSMGATRNYAVANPVTLEEEVVPSPAGAQQVSADQISDQSERRADRNGDANSSYYYIQSANRSADREGLARDFKTINGKDKSRETTDDMLTMKGTMDLKTWDSKEPYMAELKTASGDLLYKKYLQLKKQYKDMPSFYIDVADHFEKANRRDEAIRIISNLAEIKPDDSRLMRVLAHRLQQWKEIKPATAVFTEVLKIRPEEPQSYRDLGLAYAEDKEYQKAADLLMKVVNGKWDERFPEIEALTACEINYLASKSPTPLRLDSLDKRLLKDMPVDIRVVIDWDADNCDIDLWVTDPSGEKCFYSHPLTLAGGRISRDFTRGYGPEEFKLKKALEGKYKVEINYYGSSQLTLAGPTTIHAQMYTNYGKPNEQRKEIALRLATQKDVVYVGDFEFSR